MLEPITPTREIMAGVALTSVPKLQFSAAQLSELPFDSVATLLLSLVDGKRSFSAILEESAVPLSDGITACRRLLQRGIVNVPKLG